MPSNTQIKIRYGMILQAVLSKALKDAGFSFAETPAYDPDSEVPDFLIPDAVSPRFMVEVHQTDARDHFRMKTLRSLTAVAEAKAFFGADVVSVNVLFGDPDSELPAANLRAMCGIFDVNLVLRRDANAPGRTAIAAMEAVALELAGNTAVTTVDAARRLAAAHGAAVSEFQRLLTNAIGNGEVKESLRPMWVAEAARRGALGDPPAPGEPSYYKKNMVRSLFFQDEHFAAMAADPTPNAWDPPIARQVVSTGVATVTEEIDGDHLDVDPEFLSFLRDPDAPRLRGLCKEVLDGDATVRWMFEDIRDSARRESMAEHFLLALRAGNERTEEAFDHSFRNGDFAGIAHRRCWTADLMPLCLGWSHNEFNRRMAAHPDYSLSLANPFNNITIRSPRLQATTANLAIYRNVMFAVFNEGLAAAPSFLGAGISVTELADSLLKLRQVGVMRMQRFDPLDLIVRTISAELKCSVEDGAVTSILSDLGDEPALGRFDFTVVNGPDRRSVILLQAIAAEGNPRDKAKEWGARRFATLYRAPEGIAVSGESNHAVFVIDGTWNQSDVTRLYRCGWSRVIRLGQLDRTLREIFGLRENATQRPRRDPIRLDAADLSELPMAAEDE